MKRHVRSQPPSRHRYGGPRKSEVSGQISASFAPPVPRARDRPLLVSLPSVKKKSHSAFSLVEVTLALGVAAFCLVTVAGLLSVGLQTNQRATSQTAATSILSNVIADLRATPKASTTSTQYGISIPTDPTLAPDPQSCQHCQSCSAAQTFYVNSEGQVTRSVTTNSRYRLIVVFWKNPTGTNASTFADVKVTWPTAIDPCASTPGGSSEVFAAFTRN